MAKRNRIPKSVMYKRCRFFGEKSDLVLDKILSEILERMSKASERREYIDDNKRVRRVVGSVDRLGNMIFGSLLYYEIDKDVTFVVEDEDAENYILETQNPSIGLTPRDDNKKRELLESVLYFGVFENHLVLSQSKALRSRDLESHLNWLLSEFDKNIGTVLSLDDEPTEEIRQRMNSASVKAVQVGTPLHASPSSATPKGTNIVKNQKLTGVAYDALCAFLGKSVIDKLELPSGLDESNLELALTLTYKRKTTESGHKALDKLAHAFRHMEPEDTKIVTSSGATLSGKTLKLSGQVRCDATNGIPDARDLYLQMNDWLGKQLGMDYLE
ncbi:hypothetical protein KB976_002731 [Vibrio parahaemolyticus]|nr:hypothetical protein [Vibrio parahaemolyticus]